ncbi:hypothetical protein HHK36_022402 [Tetracentron sinense]|uniref:Uncharacterized protein n=1 Tax=Tetracentron sinense TaxID=13715 RepID=A0A834YUU8_TETSI|nr:hypothetical protein HHK36_022402 [Tetracentron sinense]
MGSGIDEMLRSHLLLSISTSPALSVHSSENAPMPVGIFVAGDDFEANFRERERKREMERKGGVGFEEGPSDDFDPTNPYKDLVAMLEMREHLVREKWINIETAKILQEKLKWCYRLTASKVSTTSRNAGLVHHYLKSNRGIGWAKDACPPNLQG